MKLSVQIALTIAALLVATASFAIDLSRADVAGLRIGMTVAEAEATLKAHAPDLDIQRYEITYQYSDGATQFQTPPILSRVAAKRRVISGNTAENEEFLLVFFGLPGKEVVTALKRSHAGYPNPATKADFLNALTAKYGEPTVAFQGNQYAKWTNGAGQRDCFAMTTATEISNPLMEMARAYNIEDLSTCEAGVVYSVSSDPVTGFFVTMVDPTLVEETDQQVEAWIAALESAAVKKREANAQVPKL